MTLSELLELLRESILNDRTDRVAGTSDYLWTDKTLVTYINEAQRELAVQGLVLRDSTTPEVTRITLVEGQDTYVLHEAVIAVVSAKLAEQRPDLVRVGHAVLGEYRAPTERWVDPMSFVNMQPGLPLAYSTDESVMDLDAASLSQMMFRVFPTPNAQQDGKVVRLRVVRKPLVKLDLCAGGQVPEVPEDHHISMLDYAAYLALRIVDDDAGAARRALEFRETFELTVRRARNIAMRKMFAPMGWGFGRGGYSWEA